MFDAVLVANRGEIALRVMRTLRRLGVRAVAVYSDVDAGALHVREADRAVHLGGVGSYLQVERVLNAARTSGCQAIHPGYGFLAENPRFARACAEAGISFIGPPAAALEAMGDKIRAKQLMQAAGVPVAPGEHRHGLDDDALAVRADELGYPLVIKPAAGGGGKGMRTVREPVDLPDALRSARREARNAFGNDSLLLERAIPSPRHIEVQVLADRRGTVVHLGERECSLQRRHQKIIEEAPSVLLDAVRRARMASSAVAAAKACGYEGAGTVEFIVSADDPDAFFFIEMNARLQVEHPVTELITGLDLVEWQVRIAAGERLTLDQAAIGFGGHAVEARVYAEDPTRDFLPSGGTVLVYDEPSGQGIRVDSGIAEGVEVTSHYDPLLAKVVAGATDRDTALRRLDAALARTTILGVVTNIGFLRRVLGDHDVRQGRLDTGLVERRAASMTMEPVPRAVWVAAALARLLDQEPPEEVRSVFDLPGGWRLGEPAWQHLRLSAGGQAAEIRVRGRADAAMVALGDSPPQAVAAERSSRGIAVTMAGRRRVYRVAHTDDETWVGHGGRSWQVRDETPLQAARAKVAAAGGRLLAPMPGTVTVLNAVEGDRVAAGQTLLVVEAMKMEHPIKAPHDGFVVELAVRLGQQVVIEQPLLTVARQP